MVRRFDRDFKLDAIRMASEEGHSAAEVERRLGLSTGIISRWKRQLKDNGEEVFPGTGHVSDRDEEIRRLRRELARVSQERDILKRRPPSSPTSRVEIPLHRGGEGVVPHHHDVSRHGGISQWFLRLAAASAQSSGRGDRAPGCRDQSAVCGQQAALWQPEDRPAPAGARVAGEQESGGAASWACARL